MGSSIQSSSAHRASSGGAQRDIVVVGASAGGVETLERFVADFPPELGAAIFIVLHMMPGGTSVLPEILGRRTQLHCRAARDGEPIERGRIYVAPPDHHMLVCPGRIVLTRGPRENGHRPAVDPLFRSAARAFGPRVIGVVLSGALDDGTVGLRMVSDAGGCAIVQDPEEALYPSMPRSAHDYVPTAEVLSVSRMAARICEIIDRPVTALEALPAPHAPQPTSDADPGRGDELPQGELTDLTCPECGGTLWETDENGVTRFRCHVGHAYTVGSLDLGQSNTLEGSLWAALRSLEERAQLLRRLSRRTAGIRYAHRADVAAGHAEVLRRVIETVGREPGQPDDAREPGQPDDARATGD